MSRDPLSGSYARALVELAQERGELETVFTDAEFVRGLLRDDDLFRNFVMTPSVDPRVKNETLDRIFREQLSSTLVDLIEVVLTKQRQRHLPAILEEFAAQYDVVTGRVHVEAVTAVPLPEESHVTLTDVLSGKLGKTVLLDNKVDPAILGGLILRFGDMVLDASAATQLKKISERWRSVKIGSELVHED